MVKKEVYVCNGCDKPIVGDRVKCNLCDADLCDNLENNDCIIDHVFNVCGPGDKTVLEVIEVKDE